jgi:hypothetical protein
MMRCMIAGRPPVTNMYESIITGLVAASLPSRNDLLCALSGAHIYLLAALPVTLSLLLSCIKCQICHAFVLSIRGFRCYAIISWLLASICSPSR